MDDCEQELVSMRGQALRNMSALLEESGLLYVF